MTRFLLLPVIFVIAGCVPSGPVVDVDFEDPNACGAAEVQNLVGTPLTAASGVTAPDGVRIIGPNAVVTTDLRPLRMNIEHDGTTITAINCG